MAGVDARPDENARASTRSADEIAARAAKGGPTEPSVDERLMTLELKLMDVERSVEALDAVILRQAHEIEELGVERARLEARLESLADGLGDAPSSDDERPPHY